MEGFNSKKDKTKELLTKENKGLFLDQNIFWREWQGVSSFVVPLLSMEDEEGPCDRLLLLDQKVSDSLRLHFWS